MGILDRLNRLIRSNLGDALEGGGRGSFRSALKEMESSLREARRQQAEMRRDERDLIEAVREARDSADKWEERAMLALQNDDEDLAREALKEKNQALRKSDRLREELRDHRSHMEDIEASLEALEMKLQGQKRRLKEASSRGDPPSRSGGRSDREERERRWKERAARRDSGDRSADVPQEPPTEHDDVFDTDDEFETFDRMAGKIGAMEAEIEAMRELSSDEYGGSRRSRLEQIFRKMEEQSGGRGRGRRGDDDPGDRSSRDDDLAGKKQRMDRLSELKDKFGDGDDDSE